MRVKGYRIKIETLANGSMEYTPQVKIHFPSEFGWYLPIPWRICWRNINKRVTGYYHHSSSMRTTFKTPEEAQEYINDFAKDYSENIGKTPIYTSYLEITPKN